jgi:hypothetical protein
MPDFAIKRLDFQLKKFFRNVWVSNRAGEVWHPRITRVLNYLREAELLSVARSLRKCTVRVTDTDEISAIYSRFPGSGLQAEILKRLEIPGPSLKYWAVIGNPENNREFKKAFQENDQDKMSLLQGSPQCCTDFFHKWGIEEKFSDTTWPMAVNTYNSLPEDSPLKNGLPENTVDVEPVFQCNTLLKSLGLQPVFHIPCRFNCPETIRLADQLMALGEQSGFTEETNWLREILSWPVDWSALHGIAEIKNPVLKISTSTEATAEKLTVRFKGTLYPEETVPGLVFPYLPPGKLLISDSKSFKEGLLSNPDTGLDGNGQG